MKPRIPGNTVVEAYRPNFVKLFTKSELSKISPSTPTYDNYSVFALPLLEASKDIQVPKTVSVYVRSRVCFLTHGER